jgi:hypothetical protein
MIRKIVCGCTVFVVSGVAAAQGAFDFDNIPGVDEQPAITVDINPMLVQLFRSAIAGADPEAAAILNGLRSIKLRVYSNGENNRQFNSFIDDVTEELQDSGWHAVVSAQDEGSKIRWYMQMTEQEISGMTIMAADGSEAIFMNIDGSISAEDLGRVMALPPVRDALGSFRMPPPATTSRPTTD